MNENPQSNITWEDRLTWFKSSPEYRALDRIDGEPMEFEWNIFPGSNTLQLSHKVQELLLRLGETPENFTGRIIFMSMFNDISWGSRDNKKECESNAQLVSLFAKRFGAGQWSFLGPGSEKKWNSISEYSPQGEWDKMAEKMMVTLAESGHPVFRVTSPLSRRVLKSKGGGKLSIHYCADQGTIETVFRTITSVNQFKHIYHVGCAINLHSITSSGLIPGGQNLSKRQTVFFCLWILWTKNTRILTRSTWKHRVLHNTCIKHERFIKARCIGSTSILLLRKD